MAMLVFMNVPLGYHLADLRFRFRPFVLLLRPVIPVSRGLFEPIRVYDSKQLEAAIVCQTLLLELLSS